MEPFLMTALVVWAVLRYGVTDVVAAARGTESPRLRERRLRHQQSMERRAQRHGPTVAEAIGQRIADKIAGRSESGTPGPARQAMSDWWADCWADATDRRRSRRDRRAAGDLPGQRAAQTARRWWTGDDHRPTPPRPRAQQNPPAPDPDNIVDAEIVTDDIEAQPAAPAPRTREAPAPTTTDTDPSDDGHPLASVHPIRRDVPTMSTAETTTAETLDPQAGHDFADSTASLLNDLATQIELSLTTLTGRGVTGPVVELFVQMHEQVTLAASTATEAKSHFQQQLGAQDAVLATEGLEGVVADTYLAAR